MALSDENKAVVDHLPSDWLEHLYYSLETDGSETWLKTKTNGWRFLNLCRTGFLRGHSQEGQSRIRSDALRAIPAPPLYTRAEKNLILEPYEPSLKTALDQIVDLGCVSYIFFGNLLSTSTDPTQFGKRVGREVGSIQQQYSLELIQRLTQMWSNGPQTDSDWYDCIRDGSLKVTIYETFKESSSDRPRSVGLAYEERLQQRLQGHSHNSGQIMHLHYEAGAGKKPQDEHEDSQAGRCGSTTFMPAFSLKYPNLVNTKGMGVETDGSETWLKTKTKRKPEAGLRELLSLTHVVEPQPEVKKQRQTKIAEYFK